MRLTFQKGCLPFLLAAMLMGCTLRSQRAPEKPDIQPSESKSRLEPVIRKVSAGIGTGQPSEVEQSKNGSTLDGSTLIAQAPEPGNYCYEVSNAVVRGDRAIYLLGAQGGQEMKLSIRSVENNAVFDIVDPSGIILGTELTQKTLLLPHTGDYQIIVGGTRGNATYDLSISIE